MCTFRLTTKEAQSLISMLSEGRHSMLKDVDQTKSDYEKKLENKREINETYANLFKKINGGFK